MRRISTLVTILITSFVMVLSGLVASPIATASENDGSISATFPLGSSVLSNAQKAAIKKTVASSGTDVSFIVTGTAGKLPGISDRWVQRLAKKRAQAIRAYIVSLGVSKANVTTQTKTTEIGVIPKSTGSQPTPEPTPTVTAAAAAGSSSGGGSGSGGGGGTPTVTYAVGDTGPGGGIVYYVHTADFACGPTLAVTCRYLEVAPSGWNSGADPGKVWAIGDLFSGNSVADISLLTNDSSAYNNVAGIGLGYKNSGLITTQNGTYNASTNNYAAGAARAYTRTVLSVVYSDWYLPTTAELNLLCQWNRGVTQDVTTVCAGGTLNTGTGTSTNMAAAAASGFAAVIYWSSSESGASKAWGQDFVTAGTQNGPTKSKATSAQVRPIRAF